MTTATTIGDLIVECLDDEAFYCPRAQWQKAVARGETTLGMHDWYYGTFSEDDDTSEE